MVWGYVMEGLCGGVVASVGAVGSGAGWWRGCAWFMRGCVV